MKNRTVTMNDLMQFEIYLKEEERSCITIEKYFRDVNRFIAYCGDRPITKIVAVEYKKYQILWGFSLFNSILIVIFYHNITN